MNFKIELESLFVLGKWLSLQSYLSLNKPFQIHTESNEKETLIFISNHNAWRIIKHSSTQESRFNSI